MLAHTSVVSPRCQSAAAVIGDVWKWHEADQMLADTQQQEINWSDGCAQVPKAPEAAPSDSTSEVEASLVDAALIRGDARGGAIRI